MQSSGFRIGFRSLGLRNEPWGFTALGFTAVGFTAMSFTAVGFTAMSFIALGFTALVLLLWV